MMNLESFQESLCASHPPEGISIPLQALWFARQEGEGWHRAHDLAQEANSRDGDWVHAYLHRVEGDAGNARYWYSKAGKPECKASLDAEWAEIAQALL